jgi:putative ATP-binding cassette transporter
MTLYDFLSREEEGARARILIAAAISGLANAGVLIVVAAAKQSGGQPRPGLWLLFALACGLYVYSYSYCVKAITGLTEAALQTVRGRLSEKLRQVDLLALDSIGAGKIYDQITQQTTVISSSAWLLSLGLQAISLIGFMILYILHISNLSFITIAILCAIAVPLYLRRNRLAASHNQEANTLRVRLFGSLHDLLQGFKEIRLRRTRGEDLQHDFDEIAGRLRDTTIRSQVMEQENFSFINANFYIFLALIVFVLPQLVSTGGQALHDVTAAALFLMGPLGIVSFSLPQYERASLAAASLQALEQRLDRAASPAPDANRPDAPFQHGFSRIVLADLAFAYSDPAGGSSFALGPVSLHIQRGEIVFFVGGNGSGKTTLLKALAGLYIPSSGSLLVDDIPIDDGNRQAFRENIAAIFTDFHLFKKLYGLRHRTAADVAALLEQLQIAHKTAYGDGGFTRTDLSTGQRKRIAMVVALLEDRPLYIFDEWAADQDPEFRRYYYEELLPDLKRRGKTVLAISHDDRYFHCADRVVTMEYGAVRSITHVPPPDQRRA